MNDRMHRKTAHRPSTRPDDANAFLPDPGSGPARTDDDLAEVLAEEFLEAATSAEEKTEDVRDAFVTEERTEIRKSTASA